MSWQAQTGRTRIVLEGDVADPACLPSGGRFHLRCRYAVERCAQEEPDLVDMGTAIWCAVCAQRSWIWPER